MLQYFVAVEPIVMTDGKYPNAHLVAVHVPRLKYQINIIICSVSHS